MPLASSPISTSVIRPVTMVTGQTPRPDGRCGDHRTGGRIALRIAVGVAVCTGGFMASAAAVERTGSDRFDISARLTYVDIPGITRIDRSASTDSTGAPAPASDGRIHPHPRRGFSIEAGCFIGTACQGHPLVGVEAGLSILDTSAGGSLAGPGSGPGGSSVSKEDINAFGIKLSLGPDLNLGCIHGELLPFVTVGPSRGTLYTTATQNNPSNSNNFFSSTGSPMVRSGVGTYLAYGAQLDAFYASPDSSSLLVGVGIGYQAFRSQVDYAPSSTSGGARDRISGHGLTASLSAGGRF